MQHPSTGDLVLLCARRQKTWNLVVCMRILDSNLESCASFEAYRCIQLDPLQPRPTNPVNPMQHPSTGDLVVLCARRQKTWNLVVCMRILDSNLESCASFEAYRCIQSDHFQPWPTNPVNPMQHPSTGVWCFFARGGKKHEIWSFAWGFSTQI